MLKRDSVAIVTAGISSGAEPDNRDSLDLRPMAAEEVNNEVAGIVEAAVDSDAEGGGGGVSLNTAGPSHSAPRLISRWS